MGDKKINTIVIYNGKKYRVVDKYIAFLIANSTAYPEFLEEIKDENPEISPKKVEKIESIESKSNMTRCEQCGNLITKSDYDLYGGVCGSCATENL